MLYRIAGLTVSMTAGGRTARQGAVYTVPAGARPEIDFTVACDPTRVLAANPSLENLDDAEYVGTGSSFAARLPDYDGLQLHASAVELDGRAYLFSAPSGTGKSTHTHKWERLFGAAYINDDKPALLRLAGTWYAFGTPGSGKEDLSRPCQVPLGGVAYLAKETMTAGDAHVDW